MAQPLQRSTSRLEEIAIFKRESERLLSIAKERSRRISEVYDNITKDEVKRTLFTPSNWQATTGKKLNELTNLKNDSSKPWFVQIFRHYETKEVATKREKNFTDMNFFGTEFSTADDKAQKIAEELIFSREIRRFYVYKRTHKNTVLWESIFITEQDFLHRLKVVQINADSLLPTTHMLLDRIRSAIGPITDQQTEKDQTIDIEGTLIPSKWLDLYLEKTHQPFSDAPTLKELAITLADHLDLIKV